MDWIWVLFLVFSVLGKLMEKLTTEQKAKPSSEGDQPLPPGKPFSFPPFLMDEEEEASGPVASMPREEPVLPWLSEGKTAPADPTGARQEQRMIMADEEWERLFTQQNEFDEEALGAASYTDAEELGESRDPDGREIGTGLLYDALILAHVLPRPDFRTVPWRRRL